MLDADVELLCEAHTGSTRTSLDGLLEELGAALPAFAATIADAYFSHTEMERAT